MNFRDWLELDEGWGINYDAIPSTTVFGSQMSPENSYGRDLKNSWSKELYNSNFVDFSLEDRAQDFIKLKPLNSAKQLPFSQVDEKSRLPKFDGQIFYGFTFEKIGNVDERMNQFYVDQRNEVATKLKEVMEQLKVANAKKGGLSVPQRQLIDAAFDKMVERGVPNFDRVAEFINAELERGGFKPMTTKKISEYLKNRREDVQTPVTLGKKRKKLEDQLEELKQLVFSKRYFLGAVQRAFLKKLKFPKTPEDKKVFEQIIGYAVSNYKRLNPNAHYDYVIYPQSRSSMAAEFALALATEYNAQPINGLSKKVPTLDTQNLLWKKDQEGKMQQRDLYPQLHSLDPEVKKATQQNINSQMKGGSDMQIKNVRWNHIRPFVRNWSFNQDVMRQEGVGLKGKSVLLVDDNAASGGTLQSSYTKLLEKHPRKIDIYVPIYVDFY